MTLSYCWWLAVVAALAVITAALAAREVTARLLAAAPSA
tara:strand:+ start:143 stop:259 length:117 start_codon:yes stop_codon:yes gene_type:complete